MKKNSCARGSKPPPTSKTCRCKQCDCNECPDIIEMLSASVTVHSCNLGPKVSARPARKKSASCSRKCTPPEPEPPRPPIQLSGLGTQACSCEVMARAIRADVHRYLGMVDRHKSSRPDSKRPRPPPK